MKLVVVQHNHGTKLYFDREFAAHLQKEMERLANSKNEDYCEFQSIELLEIENGGKPYRVFKTDSFSSFERLEEIDASDHDVGFMVVEESDFDKYPK